MTLANDDQARIWESRSGKLLYSFDFSGHFKFFSPCPDGSRFLYAVESETSYVCDVLTGNILYALEGHNGNVLCGSFSNDNQYIITGAADHTARMWNAENGKPLYQFKGHKDSINAVTFSKKGKYLVTAGGSPFISKDNTAYVWDLASKKLLHTLSGHSLSIQDVWFVQNDHTIVTSDASMIRYWDVQSGEQKYIHKIGCCRYQQQLSISPDGNLFITTAGDNKMELININTGKTRHILKGHEGQINNAVFSRDGKLVASASKDRTVRVWDVLFGKQLHRFKSHDQPVNSVVFSANCRYLITTSDDGFARIWPANYKVIQQTINRYKKRGIVRHLTHEEECEFLESTNTSYSFL